MDAAVPSAVHRPRVRGGRHLRSARREHRRRRRESDHWHVRGSGMAPCGAGRRRAKRQPSRHTGWQRSEPVNRRWPLPALGAACSCERTREPANRLESTLVLERARTGRWPPRAVALRSSRTCRGWVPARSPGSRTDLVVGHRPDEPDGARLADGARPAGGVDGDRALISRPVVRAGDAASPDE
jgi:hypothetical protein